MNRLFKTPLYLLTSLFVLSACQKVENVSFEKEVTIDTSNTGIDGCKDLGPFTVSFNLEDYATIEDAPNIEKAKIAMLFSSNTCLYSRVKINDSKYTTDSFNGYYNLYEYFKFQNIEDYVISSKTDQYDIAAIQLGHNFVKVGKELFDINFCTISDSSIKETWASNMDVGFDDETYYEKTGQHPEWTEKENHKGFDVTANRCVNYIENYLSNNKTKKSQQILYIFGHSRGGAVGNLIAKKLIDKSYSVVAYTMAAPLTTLSNSTNDSKYSHIYNYVNDVDAITTLPSTDWGFKRFGQDIHFNINNYAQSFKKYVGSDLPEFKDISALTSLLSSVCESRDSAYIYDEKYTIATSKALDNQAAVDKYIKEQKDRFSGGYKSLQKFLRFDVTTNTDNKYIVNVVSCAALASQLIGLALAQYGLTNAVSSVALQYYSIISVYAKLAGINNPMALKDEFDAKSVCFAHFYQSYVSYFCA